MLFLFESRGFSLYFHLPPRISPSILGYEPAKLTLLSSFSYLSRVTRIDPKVLSSDQRYSISFSLQTRVEEIQDPTVHLLLLLNSESKEFDMTSARISHIEIQVECSQLQTGSPLDLLGWS